MSSAVENKAMAAGRTAGGWNSALLTVRCAIRENMVSNVYVRLGNYNNTITLFSLSQQRIHKSADRWWSHGGHGSANNDAVDDEKRKEDALWIGLF
jgi:hypothetical protein